MTMFKQDWPPPIPRNEQFLNSLVKMVQISPVLGIYAGLQQETFTIVSLQLKQCILQSMCKAVYGNYSYTCIPSSTVLKSCIKAAASMTFLVKFCRLLYETSFLYKSSKTGISMYVNTKTRLMIV